jgi:signal transduction histidine kinase
MGKPKNPKFLSKIQLIAFSLFLLANAVLGSAQNKCVEYQNKFESLLASNIQTSIEEAEILLKEFKELDCPQMILAYNFIGFVHYNNSNQEKAKEYFLKGEEAFYTEKSNPTYHAYNQMFTALALIAENDFVAAEYYLEKAEKIGSNIKNQNLNFSINQNFGLLYLLNGQLDLSQKYYLNALNYNDLDSLSLGYIYQNLAALSQRKSNLNEALKYVNQAKTIWSGMNDAKGLYQLSIVEATIEIEKGESLRGIDVLRQGRSIYKEENQLNLGQNYLTEARAHKKLGNKEKEIIALEYALLKGDDLTNDEIKEALLDLSEVQTSDKNFEMLSQLVLKYKNKSASLSKMNTSKNKLMDSELAAGNSTIQRQLFFIIILALLFLGICYLFYNNVKQKAAILTLNKNLKASNQKIESQVSGLTEKNRDLEQFAFVASHDLKSPLRTISSFAGLLKNQISTDNAKANSYLGFITEASKDMSNMITDLLRHSTLEQEFKKEPVVINEMIDTTLSRITTQIEESNTVIKIDRKQNPTISGDASQLSVVIQNLVSNAINYSQEGTIPEIKISTEQKTQHIIIRVSDNGIGIPKEHQETIFEMFKRLKQKKVAGTGIGLATCKKIIEKHKGTLTLESEIGKGSTFVMTLPKG